MKRELSGFTVKIVCILMGSVELDISGIYFQPRSLEDFFLKKRPKSDQNGKKVVDTA